MNAVTNIPRALFSRSSANKGLRALIEAGETKTFPNKTTIFAAGANAKHLCIVLEGSVSVLFPVTEDQVITHDYLFAGDFVGETGFFKAEPERIYPSTIKTRRRTTVVLLTYEQVKQVVQEHPEVLLVISEQMAVRQLKATQRLRENILLDIQGQIYQVLCELAGHPDAVSHPRGTQVSITRIELCTFIGCSREMAGKALKALEQEGQIILGNQKNLVLVGVKLR